MLQAGVCGVRYRQDWEPREELREEYAKLQSYFPDGVKKIELPDQDDTAQA
jgi:hypothetical protein